MSTAIVTFCEQGVAIAERLREGLGEPQVYVHRSVKRSGEAKSFSSIMTLAGKLFQQYRRLVFIAPCGMVVRAIAPHLLAAKRLGLELRFIAAEEIRSTTKQFRHSPFVARKVNLPAVAEPAALLAGRRTQLILPKTIFTR
jgi:cobalamin biosynthesis protein CbiG